MKLNKNLAAALILFLAVLINYSNIFFNEFAWDDFFFIADNIHRRNFDTIPEFFLHPSTGNLYRPLRSVFYTINYQLWQLNTFGYHLNGIVLHFFATLLVFFITSKITDKSAFSFTAALFFAAHPVHTARITNMTAAFDAYGALFLLSAFFLYVLFNKKNKKRYYWLSVFAYLLALFSSEEAITLILILLLYDFSFNYNFSFGNFKLLLKKYVPYIFIAFFYLIIRFSVLKKIGRAEIYFMESFIGTLLTTAKIFVQYIIILFLPFKLTIERYVKFETTIFSIAFLISFFILLAILFLFVKSYKKSKMVFFSIGWFFITLLPFSNLVPQITIMADRYLYLPSYGFCLLLAFLIFRIRKIGNVKEYSKAIILASIIVITGIYTSYTIQRNAEWKDNFTILSNDAEKNPLGTRIHQALALHYREHGDYDNASKYALRAIELSSRNYHAYENLGTINAYQENYGKSVYYYDKAIKLNPEFYLAHNNLGLVYSYIDDLNNSLFYLKKAIEINPELAKAHNDLGTVYGKLGKFDSAIKEINKAIEINPYEAGYYYNLAVIYGFLEDYEKAKSLLLKALELEPVNEKFRDRLDNLKSS